MFSSSTGSEIWTGRGALHPTRVGRELGHAMALEWPGLGQDHLICIQKHFKSPLHLDAAFDIDLGAAELIRNFS